jgi:hypothetical protein
MFPAHSPHLLLVAHQHGRELRAAAYDYRLLGPGRNRRFLADLLRRTANRLDPTPLGRPGLT